MEVKLITGASIYEAAINTIKQIDTTNFEKNLVVVPDSFSLQAENLLFETLNIKATFNIEVVGISRLAAKILNSNNISYKRISALEEIFNIYRAVKLCEKDFQYFNKCGIDFCIKLLQIIKQFKACHITSAQIKPVGDEYLDKKMHDLKLLYEKYQELLGQQMDLSALLEFFIEKAENSIDLSCFNLYFINFDSFSLEINSFICKLAKLVNSVYIGLAKPLSKKNAFIFEDDIFKKTTALAKENNLTVETQNFETNLPKNQRLMAENLFAFDVEKGQDDFFLNVVAKNKKDEVEFVAKYIKSQIVNGARFKDFAVAVPDEKYYELIRSVFEKYGICFYQDDAIDLSQTVLGRFLFKLFEIAKLGFSKASFEYIAASPLLNVKEDAIRQIQFLAIEDEEEFLKLYPDYLEIFNLIKQLLKCKLAKEYAVVIKNIINLVQENYENLLKLLENERFFKKQSENEQAYELILKVVEKLEELGRDEEFSLADYENILKLAFKSVKVETIPTYIDAVFVGNATDSYFQNVKTLFVLGASAGALPRQQSDTGIIDDDDIKKMKVKFNLEPEIKVINRRNRVKLFEMLLHAQEKLIVLMPNVEDGRQNQRASFVDDLICMFGKNVVHTSALEEFDLGIDTSEEELNRLLFLIGCRNNLSQIYSRLKTSLPRLYAGSIYQVVKEQLPTNETYEYFGTEKLKQISASQIECYFACPFKYFLQHKMKIKPNENILPNRRVFGVVQHELLKRFLTECKDLQNFGDKEIDAFLNKNIKEIAEENYDKKVLQDKTFFKFLRNESKIILKNVVKEQKLSSFRPILLEEKIFQKIGDVNLLGYVDRVDKCGNYFRILDYKTGETKNLTTELYYGKKVQLFLYAQAIQEKLKLDCAGVYYFNCQTKFSKDAKTKLLNGITLKENDIVYLTDNSLENEDRSELIGVVKKSNPKENEFAFKYGNTEDNFESLFTYAKQLTLQAVDEIDQGYIAVKPFKGCCESCPYISICKHEQGFRNTLKEDK